MGLTFKENCKDCRSSGVKKIFDQLVKKNFEIDLFDPIANHSDIKKLFMISPIKKLIKKTYDGILIAVAHDQFKNMGIKAITDLCKKDRVIYDLKYLFLPNETDMRL